MLVVAALRKVRDLTTSTTQHTHCINAQQIQPAYIHPHIIKTLHIRLFHHIIILFILSIFSCSHSQTFNSPNSHNSSTPHTYQAYIEHTKPKQWHYLLEDCFVKQWQQANPCRLLVLSMPILLLWLRKQVYT